MKNDYSPVRNPYRFDASHFRNNAFLSLFTALFLIALVVSLSLSLELSSTTTIQSINTSEEYNPSVEEMIAQVDEDELYHTLNDLEKFPTREYGTEGNVLAATYIRERLVEIPGLEVESQGGNLNNIIATHRGQAPSSDAVIIVGAHYDSVSSDQENAPGITDNGCGIAIVLELARIMSQYEFNHTLVFAFWNAEEHGLQGSSNFTRSAAENSMNIPLYFNYDSSCYDPDARFVFDVMYNNQTADSADLITLFNGLYGINATLTYNVHSCNSDHTSFWEQGYPAIMIHSEEHGPAHTPEDTIDKASVPYARKNAQLGIPVLAKMAGIQE